jgi:hypothetical protein
MSILNGIMAFGVKKKQKNLLVYIYSDINGIKEVITYDKRYTNDNVA